MHLYQKKRQSAIALLSKYAQESLQAVAIKACCYQAFVFKVAIFGKFGLFTEENKPQLSRCFELKRVKKFPNDQILKRFMC